MSKRNEPIGVVECPHKGCSEKCQVFRFRAREHENMRRFAGKLYADCPKHGRFGGLGSDAATQDYILEKGTIWGAEKPAGNTEQKPAAAAPAAPAAASTKAEKLPAAKPARPATKQPAAPAAKPATPPAATARRSWGFFEE